MCKYHFLSGASHKRMAMSAEVSKYTGSYATHAHNEKVKLQLRMEAGGGYVDQANGGQILSGLRLTGHSIITWIA